ncbi:hypothetical protein PGAG_00126 [Phaeocystis globosa virus 12T]|uniref:Uncharacterized protein n=1 Tax=Phaeocystis globosa virus PgV-16T TaxID=3071227 RepID=A0AC59EX18_9VIRU|nr:hypothetical protein PGCG_00167 [Phaeocystis globosa virus]AET73015.1 hypothetical protein PGAG_00126 [Phaeocystis globosa virus 12T]AET73837.1 hypothetical protein PGBG_00129 [Phaeocystis globosa virus 14T]AGM15478.1 hypothetical protein PGCG_00167 [Phaeocystis globosa virus PgV-16T]UYE94208.1 hypothetical protein PGV14T_00167 [Phaeocystis globosa virus]
MRCYYAIASHHNMVSEDMKPAKYNDEYNEAYRDIFYLYAHGLINSYNEWLSMDMLDSPTDGELIYKAQDMKYYHDIYKHISKYFEIKGNYLETQEHFMDNELKTHKELIKYIMMDEYGNIEVQEIIDRIAELGDILYYDSPDKKTISLACLCGVDGYNNNRENYENDDYENYDYSTEQGYYENYYENEARSTNNTLRNI